MILQPLTWAMLKERIAQMTEQEQQQPVRVWGCDMPLKSEATLEKTDEDLYYNDDFEGICYPESELEDYKPEDCTLVITKGSYYLDIE